MMNVYALFNRDGKKDDHNFINVRMSGLTPYSIEQAAWLANKLVNLRIFEDPQGKTNQSLLDRKASALIISQFTLYADCSDGRRPSFTKSAPPDIAKTLYEQFVKEVHQRGTPVETGIFGAEMKVSLLNDGPFTLLLER